MGPEDNDKVVTIETRNFEFSESELHIDVGTTVRWISLTSTFHTVTPDGHPQWSHWQTAGVGETSNVRFDEERPFNYYCPPHLSLRMTGTSLVE